MNKILNNNESTRARSCRYCGVVFYSERSTAAFHSDACRQAWHRADKEGLRIPADDLSVANSLKPPSGSGLKEEEVIDILEMPKQLQQKLKKKKTIDMLTPLKKEELIDAWVKICHSVDSLQFSATDIGYLSAAIGGNSGLRFNYLERTIKYGERTSFKLSKEEIKKCSIALKERNDYKDRTVKRREAQEFRTTLAKETGARF